MFSTKPFATADEFPSFEIVPLRVCAKILIALDQLAQTLLLWRVNSEVSNHTPSQKGLC
jgi:hypothetical protein